MKKAEMIKRVEDLVEKYEDDYHFIGVRFENKERNIGEVIEDYSKANPDREEEREFPKYGTEEYNELDDLDGVSAYNAENKFGWEPHRNDDVERTYIAKHCYVLGCKDASYGEDENEIIMEDAVVLDIIF